MVTGCPSVIHAFVRCLLVTNKGMSSRKGGRSTAAQNQDVQMILTALECDSNRRLHDALLPVERRFAVSELNVDLPVT